MPTPFEKAVFMEQIDEAAAIRAYEAIIAEDPSHLDARVNLGRVLHEAGRYEKAERVYRDALEACGDDSILYFNLAILLGSARACAKRCRPTRRRYASIRRWPMRTTTCPCSSGRSVARGTPFGIWAKYRRLAT
jgi:tetratricopeptide (TPR) repeat protein